MDDFISTPSVEQFHFLDPKLEDIHILDIAHALSLTCRFGGHCSVFYSVAEHSILLAKILEDEGAEPLTVLAGLLHDAEEAYLPDIPQPIKAQMPDAQAIYKTLENAIDMRFDILDADWPRILALDRRLCITEAKALGVWNKHWPDVGPPLDIDLFLWSSDDAKQLFIVNFVELNEKCYDYVLRDK